VGAPKRAANAPVEGGTFRRLHGHSGLPSNITGACTDRAVPSVHDRSTVAAPCRSPERRPGRHPDTPASGDDLNRTGEFFGQPEVRVPQHPPSVFSLIRGLSVLVGDGVRRLRPHYARDRNRVFARMSPVHARTCTDQLALHQGQTVAQPLSKGSSWGCRSGRGCCPPAVARSHGRTVARSHGRTVARSHCRCRHPPRPGVNSRAPAALVAATASPTSETPQ
jgi:hypothetical protein